MYGVLLVLFTAAVLISFGAIGVVHLKDTDQLSHVFGMWIGLAHHLLMGCSSIRSAIEGRVPLM